MTGHRPWRRSANALALCCALAGPAAAQRPAAVEGAPEPPAAQPGDAPNSRRFDPQHTRFGFQLRTLWGQRVSGQFPRYDGALVVLPDGRHQVWIELSTAAVEVEGSPRYTAIARGEQFFDAARFPRIEFISVPHSAQLAHDGGPLRGYLSMHGVTRMETFTLLPTPCARPGQACDVVARGRVDRRDYGLDGWSLLLDDQVRFTMRVRLADPAASPQPSKVPASPAPAPARSAR